MEFISHRVNKIEELIKLNTCYGVEIDLRDDLNGNIYMEHDPFKAGENFVGYLKAYNHGTMILNIKSERIELKALELLEKYKISNYFFLDSSFPMIKLLTDNGIRNIALRFSEFEGMDILENMKGKVDWVWIDCFTKLPFDFNLIKKLRGMGYKLCLVSPELQGQEEKLEIYGKYLVEQQITFDAICTKGHNISMWNKILKIN